MGPGDSRRRHSCAQTAKKPKGQKSDQARRLKVPDQTSPVASEKLMWKFHFFKGQWSCKPIFIYSVEAATGSPPWCRSGDASRCGSPPAHPREVHKRRSKTKGNFSLKPGHPLFLDTRGQVSMSTKPPEKVPHDHHRPTAFGCCLRAHQARHSPARHCVPFAALVTDGGKSS